MKNVIGKYNRLWSVSFQRFWLHFFRIVSELLHLWAGLGKPSQNCWFWVLFFGFLGQDSSILLHLGHFYQTAPPLTLCSIFISRLLLFLSVGSDWFFGTCFLHSWAILFLKMRLLNMMGFDIQVGMGWTTKKLQAPALLPESIPHPIPASLSTWAQGWAGHRQPHCWAGHRLVGHGHCFQCWASHT